MPHNALWGKSPIFMRHRKRGRKLGHSSAHHNALGINILRALFEHGQIITTIAKAKEFAPLANKMITFAKRSDRKIEEMEKKLRAQLKDATQEELTAKITQEAKAIKAFYLRYVYSKLPDRAIVQKIFNEIAPLNKNRKGGYTSILHLNKYRVGDNARLAVLRLVEKITKTEETGKKEKAAKPEKKSQTKA